MAHMVESMFYVGEVPWHSLGRKLEAPPTSEEAIRAAGLDWTVERRALRADGFEGNALADVLVPGFFATVRTDRELALGVVAERYTVLQNRDAFGWFDPIVESGAATYETAGSLRDGRIVWILARIKGGDGEVVPGDPIERRILLTHGHDGSHVVTAMGTNTRVVCNNTLTYALNGSATSSRFRIRHTQSMHTKLGEARDLLAAAEAQQQTALDQYRALASKQLTEAEIKIVVEQLIPKPANEETSDTRRQNQRTSILELVETGAGTEIPGVKGTAWGLFNAVTEYVDHVKFAKKDQEARFETTLLTSGNDLKLSALELLTKVTRGEVALAA